MKEAAKKRPSSSTRPKTMPWNASASISTLRPLQSTAPSTAHHNVATTACQPQRNFPLAQLQQARTSIFPPLFPPQNHQCTTLRRQTQIHGKATVPEINNISDCNRPSQHTSRSSSHNRRQQIVIKHSHPQQRHRKLRHQAANREDGISRASNAYGAKP